MTFSTSQPISRFLTCQGYEIHLSEWGNPDLPDLIMWHGLARTGRDFDTLARSLCDRYHIIAPDTLGRGLTQWAKNPEHEYCLDFYGKIATDICESYKIDQMRWVGTSMGGALGMRLAGGLFSDRISHLVINDIGPKLVQSAIDRILTYAGNPPIYQTVKELEQGLRQIYKPYGYLSDAEWQQMAETSTRRLPDGRVTFHYDPKMVQQFISHPNDYDQWDYYDKITCPTLLLRGVETDLLDCDTRDQMCQRGPKCQLLEIEKTGHAPALNVADQINVITEFLA